MCDTSPSDRSISRRSLLGAMAGTGVVIASATGCAPRPRRPRRPCRSARLPHYPCGAQQPKGTVVTLFGMSGGPHAEYGRTGTSTALTVEGYNYVIDAGRSSVTQYLNAGLTFSALTGMFITHLHADHLADYCNYFLLEGGEPNAEKDNLSEQVADNVFAFTGTRSTGSSFKKAPS